MAVAAQPLRRSRFEGARGAFKKEPALARGLIVCTSLSALIALAFAAPELWQVIVHRPVALVEFSLVAVALASTPVQVYGRGSFTFAGAGLLAMGFMLGTGAAMVAAFLVAAVVFVRSKGLLHRAVFNAVVLALSAASGSALFHGAQVWADHGWPRLLAAVAAGAAFLVVNISLISSAMSISERLNPLAVWNERFRWMTPYYLASGALALAVSLAYDALGVGGLAAFTLPPAFMMLSIRQYLDRTTESVEEVRRANTDLNELLLFANGLAAHTHDHDALVDFAERELATLSGGSVHIDKHVSDQAVALVAGGDTVGGLTIFPQGEGAERWLRIGDTVRAHLSTALETTLLVARVRKTNRDLIAALSRSMEAKDFYTGGHTERVASIAVALARQLGLNSEEAEAIEIGALVHDIGKIGVPEAILNKRGPLDADEWETMRRHPIISDFILSGVDLHPFVRQAARSSHERIDGTGYPDGLRGDNIPLPARIVLMADAWDALTSDRPYRPAREPRQALAEIRSHSGTQFCPHVFAAFEQLATTQPDVLGFRPERAERTPLAS